MFMCQSHTFAMIFSYYYYYLCSEYNTIRFIHARKQDSIRAKHLKTNANMNQFY